MPPGSVTTPGCAPVGDASVAVYAGDAGTACVVAPDGAVSASRNSVAVWNRYAGSFSSA